MSIGKLDDLLSKYGALINKVFIDHKNRCRFVEVTLTEITENILLYVSKDINIKIRGSESAYNIIQIEPTDYNSSGDIIDRYVDEELLHLQSSKYKSVELNDITTSTDFEDKNEQMYNKPITVNSKKYTLLKQYRQIYRLGQCVRNSNHKLSIISNNYLLHVNSDNLIDIYKLKTKNVDINMYPVIRLENAYSNPDILGTTCVSIIKQLSNILNEAFNIHVSNISNKSKNVMSVIEFKSIFDKKIILYEKRLVDLGRVYERTLDQERKYIDKKITTINSIMLKTYLKQVHRDLDIKQQTSSIDRSLIDINETKKELIRNILSIKSKKIKLILKADSISFDIAVMLDKIDNSLQDITSFSKKISI